MSEKDVFSAFPHISQKVAYDKIWSQGLALLNILECLHIWTTFANYIILPSNQSIPGFPSPELYDCNADGLNYMKLMQNIWNLLLSLDEENSLLPT